MAWPWTFASLPAGNVAASKLDDNFNAAAQLASPAFTGTPTAPTPSSGDNSTKIATTAFVATSMTSLVIPVGMITPYGGTAAPSGWLLCDGSPVSRTTYATLFALTGTAFGAGDGSTTFNVPDLRGRAPFGLDDLGGSAASRVTSGGSGIAGTTLGASGGDQLLQAHNHSAPGGRSWNVQVGSDPGYSYYDGATVVPNTGATGGGSGQNMPPAIMVGYIIKY